jgi:hypothetical protein
MQGGSLEKVGQLGYPGQDSNPARSKPQSTGNNRIGVSSATRVPHVSSVGGGSPV